MTIPALPDAPALGDSPEVFNTKAFAFVAALDDWGTAANAVGVAADADASAAAASASTATTQAGIATTKANEAAASALDANSAELAAQAAQTAAELAATNAAASYDSFDDRYLGAKSSDPSVDNDGGALIIGALYFNTTDQKMKVYASTGWKDAGSAVNGTARRQTFTATAGQTSFTVTDGYDANFADVYLNGVKLVNGTDVTVSSGTAVVLASGAAAGDVLDVVAYGAFEVANTYTQGEADALFLTKANPSYSGTLTGGTGVVNLGSGQFYKDSSGNVGIGTSSPTNKFDVYDATSAVSSVSGDGSVFNVLARASSDSSGPQFSNQKFRGTIASPTVVASGDITGRWVCFGYDGTTLRPTSEIRSVVDGTPGDTDMPGRLVFYTTPDGSATSTERARIDSSGNLLVNRTSGLASAKIVVESDTTSANPMAVSNSRSTAATDYSILFYRNASLVGSVQTSLSATSYVTSSDYRLKENVSPMTGALNKVAQLKPCTYTWKLDGSDGQGFIAHELQAVVPDCVTGEKDAVDADGNPVYQGIDTSFLVATLTAAIQEQQAIIEQLKADVAELKGQA